MEGTGAYLKRDEEEADLFSFFHRISMEGKGFYFLYKGRSCHNFCRKGFPMGGHGNYKTPLSKKIRDRRDDIFPGKLLQQTEVFMFLNKRGTGFRINGLPKFSLAVGLSLLKHGGYCSSCHVITYLLLYMTTLN
eukprot:TRINITY_DN603_c3_g1_i1.p1 TRINITY_DN603_c3_g1~~TRINITY_DN603_c3_g1_i1.p1  ORF type:complete len:134 (+),score=16.15 TRINITY_DN603_c3_g1_i1:618-1019(+)